jgi:hypothetical protein
LVKVCLEHQRAGALRGTNSSEKESNLETELRDGGDHPGQGEASKTPI